MWRNSSTSTSTSSGRCWRSSSLQQHATPLRHRSSSSRAAAAAAAAAPVECDVAVVGAGPAGLAAAAALRVADPALRVRVFERTNRTAKGAAVLVGVNGLLALQAIDPQLLERLLSRAIKLEGSDRYSMDTGEFIEHTAMSNDSFRERFGFHNALLGWSDITDALASALPEGAIVTNAPVTGFTEAGDGGKIQLLGPAASDAGDARVIATCRALVGADGWFSGIRAQLLADGPPQFKDVVVFRARIKRPEGHPESRTKWWVPHDGRVNNGDQLAVLIPVPGGDLVWQCHVPHRIMVEKGLSFDAATGEAASSHADNTAGGGSRSDVKARCLAAFDSFPPAFTDVVRATPAEAITEHGLYQRTAASIPADSWGSGLVTLAGDSAHTAFVDGTGLALSLEDAAVLGWHVQQQGLTEGALRAYERERIPRVKAIFELGDTHARKMREGVPQAELLPERVQLLYAEAAFKPLERRVAAAAAAAAVAG